MVYEIVKTAYRGQQIKSCLIGSPKSFILKRLGEDGIPFDFYVQDQFNLDETDFSKNDLLINFHNFDGLYKLRDFDGATIIWSILARQITGWNRFGFERKLTGKKLVGNFYTRKLLGQMYEKNSLINMDGATSDAIDEFMGKKHNWPIVPIPVDVNDIRNPKRKKFLPINVMQISYIGRSGSVWKRRPVRKFIQDLAKLKNIRFKINIYTDRADPYVGELETLCNERISIEYYIGLYGSGIRDHLSQHSDLHFSMGTAALEGGLAGLPTVLIDPSYYDFPENYRYRWLYQTERNSLGRFISEGESNFVGMTMEEVIETCSNEEARNAVAAHCAQYVLENHSALRVTEKILAHATKATMEDICRFTPASWPSVNSVKMFLSGVDRRPRDA